MDYCGFADWGPCAEPFSLANTGGGTELALLILGVGIACLIIGGVLTWRKRR